MDYLQEGIGLRAMAQRDPLVEYQREGFDMFNTMLEAIKEESVGHLYHLEVEIEEQPSTPTVGATPVSVAASASSSVTATVEEGEQLEDEVVEPLAIHAKGLDEPKRSGKLDYSGPGEDGGVEHSESEVVDKFADVNRNDPCPCGSGKKFKRCHGDPRSA
jgi:preprotein translocase subunit SecA